MTCREANAFLADYLAGALAFDVRERFEDHVAECPDCLAYLRSYAAAVRVGRGVLTQPEHPSDEEIPDELVQAIVAAARRGGRGLH